MIWRPGVARRHQDPDRGAAIVWSLALVSLIILAGLLAGAVGQLAVVRQRAAAAADMAALAAAQAEGDGCAAAARTAEANDTSLVACSLDGLDVVVRVSRRAPTLVVRLLAWLGQPASDVTAAARAGPPEPAPG